MTSRINSNREALLKVSTGYTIAPDGTQVQSYKVQPKVIQTQSMSVEDLKHIGFTNQQGTFLKVYADGMIPAIRRALGNGTSIVVMKPYGETDPTEWIVKAVLESYGDEIPDDAPEDTPVIGWVSVLIQNTGKKSPHDTRYFGFSKESRPFNQGVFA